MIIGIEIFQEVIPTALIREGSLVGMQATILVKTDGIVAEMKLTKALIEEVMKQAVTLINEEMDITAIGIEDPLIDRSRQEILKNPEKTMIEHLLIDSKVKEKRAIEAELETETEITGILDSNSTEETIVNKRQGQIALFSLEQI